MVCYRQIYVPGLLRLSIDMETNLGPYVYYTVIVATKAISVKDVNKDWQCL